MHKVLPSSLEHRVTWAITGMVAVFLLVIGVLAYGAFDQMEDDLVNQSVKVRVDQLRDHLAATGELPAGIGKSKPDAGGMQAWLEPKENSVSGTQPLIREIHRDGRTWHVWAQPVSHGVLFVRYEATSHERRVHTFAVLLACGIAVAMLTAWLLARWAARRAVFPIRTVSMRLASWSTGHARDVAVEESGDEAERLIQAFSRVQDRVDKAMAFERQFSANLSHELRTPLAALRSDAEMALLDVDAGSRLESRLQRMIAQVDTAVDSLTAAVAFNQADPSRQCTVNLREALEQAWFSMQGGAQTAGLVLENSISEQEIRVLDPHALLIVMRNLLRNAIEHAAPALLRVWMDDEGALVFRDNGPGLSADRLQRLAEWREGRRDLSEREAGSGHHGLGLGIAQRVCDLQGWRLIAESDSTPGSSWAMFRVVLSSSP